MTDPPREIPFPQPLRPGPDLHRSATLSSILFSGLEPPICPFMLYVSRRPRFLALFSAFR